MKPSANKFFNSLFSFQRTNNLYSSHHNHNIGPLLSSTTGSIPSSTSSSSSSYHHYNHHHHMSMFSIGKLRLSLYFFCIFVITTSLYCLVSYRSPYYYDHHLHLHHQTPFIVINNNLDNDNNNDNHDVHHNRINLQDQVSNSLLLLSSSKQAIMDNVIHMVNQYYLDYFHLMILNNDDDDMIDMSKKQMQKSVPNTNNNNNNERSIELYKLAYMIDNLTQMENNNDYNLKLLQNSIDNNNNNNKYLQERDNNDYADSVSDYDNDDDNDSNSIEYQLRQLGFNLKHIVYLYARNHPENITMSSMLTSINPDSSSSSSSSATGMKSNRYHHQRHAQIKSKPQNLSGLLSDEFLGSIIFITAIDSNQFQLAKSFINSFEHFRHIGENGSRVQQQNSSNFELMIYDLGLYPDQLSQIERLCQREKRNRKRILCTIRTFQYDIYPSHVSDLRMAAYRSIIIQEMLRDIKLTRQYRQKHSIQNNKNYIRNKNEKISKRNFNKTSTTTIIWMDPQYHFIDSKHSIIGQLQSKILHQSAILSWPIEQPTSALTHPRMFEYFHTTKENFYFHRMIRPDHLMITINDKTWKPFEWGIMLPWVRCALTSDCIAPLGSQWRSTCRLDKKPHYRYSGCHHYDMSALNVVLGIAFNFSSTPYSARLSQRFFWPFNRPMPIEKQNSQDDNEDDDIMFEYQFEDGEDQQTNNVPGRYDLVMNDDDIPEEFFDQSHSQKKKSSGFLFSSSSSSTSSGSS
ncbi:uncharacterized protein LOC124498286 [Dermatophagoides farinae]|uniref:uncharacterized protein LOC124498286 n=1 Tax=Dermatophagoides farinae TaxID=6954 RepID=UPI003F5F9939